METSERDVIYVAPGEGGKLWIMGTDLMSIKATGDDTGGAYALLESLVLGGGGPPPHIHQREDEAFYILEGEFEFTKEGGTVRVGSGSFVHVPRGALHAFRNVGDEPGRMLTLVVPAGLERFFEEIGDPGTDVSSPPDEPPNVEEILTIASEYGIRIPPPE